MQTQLKQPRSDPTCTHTYLVLYQGMTLIPGSITMSRQDSSSRIPVSLPMVTGCSLPVSGHQFLPLCSSHVFFPFDAHWRSNSDPWTCKARDLPCAFPLSYIPSPCQSRQAWHIHEILQEIIGGDCLFHSA